MRAAFQAAALLGGIVAATGWSQQKRLRPPEALDRGKPESLPYAAS